ncbi:MAG: polysaccharide deacetylase family protein [Candidatus Dactylopiibacterium sp.]|nr:polysaccharide deacetylase family protein [Candidatus Dactylopiibacterium sp.]
MNRWHPSPFILASCALHALLVVLLVARPAWWPLLLGACVANHLLLALAGLLPRTTLLGANLVRLPAAAAARGEVAITLDDGPDPAVTPRVLEILAAHGARATFFCIGERAAAHPELVRAIVAAGHDVENHGQRHRNHLAFSALAGWRREILDAQATLETLTGRAPRFYRALAGIRNPFLDPVLAQAGLRLASWTRRGYDTRNTRADDVLARLTRGLAAGDILLLHDGHAARDGHGEPVILKVLPALLSALAERRLHSVPLRTALS